MIDLLLGVPKQLADLLARLSATWAGKLDTLEARLTSLRAGYLDTLNVTGALLTNAVWTDAHAAKVSGSAQETSPLLDSPMSSAGFAATPKSGTFDGTNAATCCADYASTASTTDVTLVSVTGSGVLNFLLCTAAINVYGYLTLIIDGVTIFNALTTTNNACVLVGVGCYNPSTGNISIDQIPFKTSLVIKHKAGSGTCLTAYKYRRTS